MKFTLSWLKDHLDTDATLDTIVGTLTAIGLEVEAVDDKASLKPFVIARVDSAEKHPDADKLKVLKVDTGDGALKQVVCGAPNARSGLVGAFAPPGTYIPGTDMQLSVGRIRGVESHGMMCSERELMLSDDHDGIIDLPEDAPIGAEYAAWADIDDPVIEIGLTPNRPDCTGVYGIARDLAAAGLGTLRDGTVAPVEAEAECPVSVSLDFGDTPPLCLGFALRLVRGVKNGPSPVWLQRRLRAIGMRPISMLVDVTNYITFDRGRPLHVFDAAKVAGNLVVRRARDGEKILALDEREYELTSEMCVIADDNGVESLSGVMGGEHSGCDETTVDVLIESALWEPLNIARTGRDLGIITDARYRFERGVDPEFMESGMELATRMIVDACGGEASKPVIVDHRDRSAKSVSFPTAEVRRLTGIEVSPETSAQILQRLGFVPDGVAETMLVRVPSWRPDIDGKADLVEEVMRIHGVDKIAPQPMISHQSVNSRILTTLQQRTRHARRALGVRGMMEAVSWSFIPAEHARLFGGGSAACRLANPIAADMSDMRPSLLPGLLAAAQRNADRGNADIALFEVSDTYEDDTMAGQRRVAGGLRRGTATLQGRGRHWAGAAKSVDVFDAKADALAVLEACGVPVERVQIEAGGSPWHHPGRSGQIRLGPKILLGTFGELHPRTLRSMDVAGPVAVFEVFLDAVPEAKRKPTRTKPRLDISNFQSVRRDFAFVVDRAVNAQALARAAAAADKKLITGVDVFDVFEGESIGADAKSIAVEVAIQPTDRTLTDAELEQLAERIIDNVGKATGGVLRR